MFNKLIFTVLLATIPVMAQSNAGNPSVLTGQYNIGRTGANSNEIALNPSNVNVAHFGRLFSWNVDGQIYAQPLYMGAAAINGVSRNLVFVATMNNTIYAFDADNPTGGYVWSTNLGTAVSAPSGNGCPSSDFTGPQLGILGTPVIDPATNTLYAISVTPSGSGYQHFIHALDIATGNKKIASQPVQASVSGSGYNSVNGKITMGPASTEVQRTALLLANGKVYAGFGNCGPDNDPWHGWVVGYNSSNLTQQVIFNATPNGGQGGIWQSGRGLVADSAGDLYFATGNATPNGFGTVTTGTSTGDANNQDYPMRLLQLSSTGQFLASFPPPQYTDLNNYDLDFSSSGPLLIPGTSLLLAGGKDGIVYVFDTTKFGTPVQSFQASGGSACNFASDACAQIHSLAFWNNTLYLWSSFDYLRAYRFTNGHFNPTEVGQNNTQMPYQPASVAVSGNSTNNGIVWATTPDNTLHAIDASNVASELWNSNLNQGRDGLPSAVRFVQPTVTNGRVYMPTLSNQLVAYGLLSDYTVATSASSLTANQGASTSFTVTVTALTATPGTVNLSVTGLPAGATASFNPPSLTGSGSSTVTITTAATTPTGTSSLIVRGTVGNEIRTASTSLKVTTPDTTPPTATCCTYTTSGSSYVMQFTAQDTGSGLSTIVPVQVVNATTNVPAFTQGTNSVVNFTATESGWSSYVKFQVTDVAGNSTYIDPVVFDSERQPGAPVPFAVKNIGKAEGIITLQNGNPGLKNVRIQVNNGLDLRAIEVAGLKDGENRVIDLTSALVDILPNSSSSGSTVQITPLGKPGGKALFVFGPNPIYQILPGQ